MRYHYTPIRMIKFKKKNSDNTKCWRRYTETESLIAGKKVK